MIRSFKENLYGIIFGIILSIMYQCFEQGYYVYVGVQKTFIIMAFSAIFIPFAIIKIPEAIYNNSGFYTDIPRDTALLILFCVIFFSAAMYLSITSKLPIIRFLLAAILTFFIPIFCEYCMIATSISA